MFYLKFFRDSVNILRAGQTPAQVAGGFALGDAKKKELTDRLDKEKNWKVNDVLKVLFKK